MPHIDSPQIAHLEDNEADHVLLQKALGDHYHLTHFRDVKAFSKSKEIFDLIITDLGLVQTFGAETVKAIRAQNAHTPIFALTGLGGAYITGDIVKTLMDAGANNVVSKEIITDPRILALFNELINQ